MGQKPFENFFLEHALTFKDVEEHDLEYTKVYEEFQSMFDKHMAVFQRQQDLKEGDLMERLKESEKEDPRASHYLKIIVASMEYDAFVKLMKQMRGRSKALQADAKSEAPGKDSSKMSKGSKPAAAGAKGGQAPKAEAKGAAPAASEGKQSAKGQGDAKGGGGAK